MSYFKDHYEVVIIGGGLAGMASALALQSNGVKDILILEKHNMPGGLATDYVRGGHEMEATLHEMMSIGPKDDRLKVGKFFDEMGIDIDWLKVPECYRVVLPNSDIDVTLHDGYETVAREIDAAVPGTYAKVLDFLQMCRRVYDSVNILSVTPASKVEMLLKHPDFVKTLGYSATEVLDTYHFPKKVVEILTAYWIYVGNPMDTLPFTIYAFLLADYFTGSYVCRGFSHEMSLKMQTKVEENGAQYELRQEVEKILVADDRVRGVRTKRGDEIACDYVISAAYPNKVYSQMIEPLSEVPEGAIKMINGRKLSVCPVSIMMMVEGTPAENGIKNYSTFSGSTMDTNEIWKNASNITEPYNYITTICVNYANPDAVREGYTQLSITALVPVTAFEGACEEERLAGSRTSAAASSPAGSAGNGSQEDYFDLKRRLANEMIEEYVKISGVDFRDRIAEIEVSTPMTISHYVGAWKGSIYGYSHSMDDHVVARLQMEEEDHFIEGLEFAGAHSISGDGMGPAITNGRAAARAVLADRKKKEAAR